MQQDGPILHLFSGKQLLNLQLQYIVLACYLFCNEDNYIRHYTLSDLLLASLYESFLVSSAIKSNVSNKSELFT